MLPNLRGLISTDDGACSARWGWAFLAVESQSAPQPRLLDEKVSGVTLVDWAAWAASTTFSVIPSNPVLTRPLANRLQKGGPSKINQQSQLTSDVSVERLSR
jgi:hypothetical protein